MYTHNNRPQISNSRVSKWEEERFGFRRTDSRVIFSGWFLKSPARRITMKVPSVQGRSQQMTCAHLAWMFVEPLKKDVAAANRNCDRKKYLGRNWKPFTSPSPGSHGKRMGTAEFTHIKETWKDRFSGRETLIIQFQPLFQRVLQMQFAPGFQIRTWTPGSKINFQIDHFISVKVLLSAQPISAGLILLQMMKMQSFNSSFVYFKNP